MKNAKFLICCVIVTAMVCLTGCGNTGRTLTSATGSIYECLVVMNDRPLDSVVANPWSESNGSAYAEDINSTYKLVAAALEAEMPCMPQVEPTFKLTHVSPAAFDDLLKPTRNILIIDIDPAKYTAVKAKVSTDVWSTPQAVYRIQAPTDKDFAAYWMAHAEEIREWFVQEELRRQIRFYAHSTSTDACQKIASKWDYQIAIPEEYMLILDTTFTTPACQGDVEVVWCCNNKGSMRRDVVVYTYPYTDSKAFDPAVINACRDSIMGRLVTGQAPRAHMGTEYRVCPPVSRQIRPLDNDTTRSNSFYAIETRGLWKMLDGEALGGPYVSHTRLDMVNARVVTAEAFVVAPGQKKRNALRQAEAILYTLRMPDEHQKTTPSKP